MELLPRLRKLSEWRGIRARHHIDKDSGDQSNRQGHAWNENGWSFKPREIGVTNAATRRRRQFTGIIHASDVKALFSSTRKSKLTMFALIVFIITDILMFCALIYWLLT